MVAITGTHGIINSFLSLQQCTVSATMYVQQCMYSQWTQLINQNLPHSYFGHQAWQIVIWNIFAHTQCLQSNSTKTIQKLDPRSQKLAQEEGMHTSLVWYGGVRRHTRYGSDTQC